MILSISSVSAQTETSTVASGEWTDTATWSDGVPNNVNGTSWAASLTDAGIVTLSTPVTVTDLSIEDGVNLDGSAKLTVLRSISVLGSGSSIGGSVTLRNEGNFAVQFGSLDVGANAGIENPGSINLINTGGISRGLQLANTGTITKSGISAESALGIDLLNGGAVEVTEGTLRLDDPGQTIDGVGTFDIAEGAELLFRRGYNFQAGSAITGRGFVNFDTVQGGDVEVTIDGTYTADGHLRVGAIVNLNTAITVSELTLASSTFSRAPELRRSGNVAVLEKLTMESGSTLSGGVGTTLILAETAAGKIEGGTLTGNRTLVNNGTLEIASISDDPDFGNRFSIGNGAALINDGTLRFVPAAKTFGTGTLRNNATLESEGPTLVNSINNPLLNAGTVRVLSGTLEINGSSQTLGAAARFEVAADATLTFGEGTHVVNSTTPITGDGSVEFSAGDATIDGTLQLGEGLVVSGGQATLQTEVTSPKIAISGGTVEGSGNLTANTEFALTGGTLAGGAGTTLTLSPSASGLITGGALGGDRRIINQGDILLSAATLATTAANSLRNEGTLRLIGDASITGSAPLENTGTLVKATELSESAIEGPFTNSGTVRVLGGRLRFASSINLTASSNVIVELTGADSPDGLIEAGGPIINDGTLTIRFVGDFRPADDEMARILKTDGASTGNFTTVQVESPGYTARYDSSTQSVTFNPSSPPTPTPTPTPEPIPVPTPTPAATPVPTPTPERPGDRPEVTIRGKSRLETARSRIKIRGRASDDGTVAEVQVKAPGSKIKTARGTRRWRIRVQLREGRNLIKVRAIDGTGKRSKPEKVRITRKQRQ